MKKTNIPVLLTYGIPWCAILLWADSMFVLAAAMAATGFLAWHCSKKQNKTLVILGNALSAVLTLALLCWAYFGGLWQFELFGPFGWTVFLLALTIPVQAFCWNRYWGILAAYLGILVGIVGLLYAQMLRL